MKHIYSKASGEGEAYNKNVLFNSFKIFLFMKENATL